MVEAGDLRLEDESMTDFDDARLHSLTVDDKGVSAIEVRDDPALLGVTINSLVGDSQ